MKNSIRLGYCCLCKSVGDKGKFRAMTVKKATSMNEDDRYKEIQQRTRENFSNLYDITKWNIENNIRMYRVSSDMAVLHTHEICNYDFREDSVVIDLANKIKEMAKDNDILHTIHCDQFNVINSDREEVFQNTIKSLEYHCDLMDMLGIKYNCIHVGGKKGGVELGKERFVNNFIRMPERVQKSIMLENCDKSYNVSNTLELCEILDIPMTYDYHHSRILKSELSDSEYMDRIVDTWKGQECIGHLSSSADEYKLVSKHHDYITEEDMIDFIKVTGGRINCELECKQKDLALLRIKACI